MKATRLIAVAVFASSALLAAPPVSAQGPFYVGGSVGQSDIDDEAAIPALITSGTVDSKKTAFKIFGGYQFDPNFGLELSYVDLNSASYSGTFFGDPVISGKVELWGFNFSAVGTLPVSPTFALFGKAGLFFWEAKASDITGGIPFSATDDGVDLSIGLGMSVNLTKNVSVRAEWERFMTDVADADLLSIGIAVRF
ncbi:MAG: outer membrane beta-barrel protein [Burkholderiales bacterium]